MRSNDRGLTKTKSVDMETKELPKYTGISIRAFIATAIGVVIALYVVFNGEYFGKFKWEWYDSSISSPNVVATGVMLVMLLIVNPILKFLKEKLVKRMPVLTDSDFAIVFNAVSAASQVAHAGFFAIFLTVTAGLTIASRGTSILGEYFEQRSSLILIKDFREATSYITGRGDLNWALWIPMLITWGLFFGAIVFMFQCVAVITHRSWKSQEHLSYPTVKPILMLTEGAETGFPPILTNRLTWAGLLLAVIYRGLPAMHSYFPVVPNIDHFMGHHLVPLMSNPFLNTMISQTAIWPLPLWPWALSLMWLVVTSHVLFSIWFFAVFRGFYFAILNSYGLLGHRGMPFPDAQPGWLFTLLGAYYVWMMRRSLKEVFLISIGKQKETVDSSEQAMSSRFAFFGCIVAFIFIIGFAWYFFSLSVWLSIPLLAIFILSSIATARFRAEAGFGFHGVTMAAPGAAQSWPIAGFTNLLGGGIVKLQNLMGIGYFGILFNALTPNIGSTLEALHMAESRSVRPKSVLKAIWIAMGLTVILAFTIGLPAIYANRGPGMFPIHWSYQRYYGGGDWWQGLATVAREHQTTGFDFFQLGFLSLFGVINMWLMYMNTTFAWWPFHPIGFAIASWRWTLPAFIAWVLKSLTFRWGGLSAWKKLNPFFIGLLAGDFITIVLQTGVSIFIG